MRVLALAVVLSLVTSAASADTSSELPVPAEGADEALYSCKPRTTEVEITFKPEIERKELLVWVVGFTCKKFVLDPRIVSTGRKVTLIAPGKQTAAPAYEMFTTALATLGLTVVPKGKLMVVVEAAYGKGLAPPLLHEVPGASEQIVRYVMRPQYATPELLRQAVVALKSDVGDVQTVGALVMITDHASNVRDMASIAKLIDVPGGTDGIYTIPVLHADAAKLADKLGMLVAKDGKDAKGGGKDSDTDTTPSKILVDDRTNTLIVAGTPGAYQRVRALVERLDIALDIEGQNLHVYQVGHAVADELAKTLTDAIQAQSQNGTADKRIGQLGGADQRQADEQADRDGVGPGLPRDPRGHSRARRTAAPGLHRGDDPRGADRQRPAGRDELARWLHVVVDRLVARRWRAGAEPALDEPVDADVGKRPDRRSDRLDAYELCVPVRDLDPVLRDPVSGARRYLAREHPVDDADHRCRQRAGQVQGRHERSIQERRAADLVELRRPDLDEHRAPAARARARDQAAHLDERLGTARGQAVVAGQGRGRCRARPDLDRAQRRDARADPGSADRDPRRPDAGPRFIDAEQGSDPR